MAMASSEDSKEPASFLPKEVVAIVIGIENYQPLPTGQVPTVAFARNDAEAFAKTLADI